ncbi:MAG: 4Fe-4S binding protein, partial [Nitrosopumilaceae archaeon]
YPERCISDGACIGVCPTKSIFWMRPMNYTAGQPVPLHKNGVFVKGWAEDAAL